VTFNKEGMENTIVETSFCSPCIFFASLSVLTILKILISLMIDEPVEVALLGSAEELYW
jgi:hypothetical protein